MSGWFCRAPVSSAAVQAATAAPSPFSQNYVQQQQQHHLHFLANALQLQSQLNAHAQLRPPTPATGQSIVSGVPQSLPWAALVLLLASAQSGLSLCAFGLLLTSALCIVSTCTACSDTWVYVCPCIVLQVVFAIVWKYCTQANCNLDSHVVPVCPVLLCLPLLGSHTTLLSSGSVCVIQHITSQLLQA